MILLILLLLLTFSTALKWMHRYTSENEWMHIDFQQDRLFLSPSSWLCVALPSVLLSPHHSTPPLHLMHPRKPNIQRNGSLMSSPLQSSLGPVSLTPIVYLRNGGTWVRVCSTTVHLLLLDHRTFRKYTKWNLFFFKETATLLFLWAILY